MTRAGNNENQNMVRSFPAAPIGNPTASDVIEYFRSFPVGYMFNPTDEELIGTYLMRKVNDQPLPPNLIHVVDIYGQHPSEITQKYRLSSARMTEWYFFTSRQKKYPKGQRPDRAIGNGIGFWKATGRDKKISKDDQPIGTRRSLDFFEGRHPHGNKTMWKMHEFVIHDRCIQIQRPRSGMTLDNWVLCKIYQTGGGKRTENGHDDQNSNDPATEASLIPESQNSDSYRQVLNRAISSMSKQGANPECVAVSNSRTLIPKESEIPQPSSNNNFVSADQNSHASYQQVVDGEIFPMAQQDSRWTRLLPIDSESFQQPSVSTNYWQFDYGASPMAQQGTNAIQTADFTNNIVSADHQNLYAWGFDYGAPPMAQQGTNAIHTADFTNNIPSQFQYFDASCLLPPDSDFSRPCFGLNPTEQFGPGNIQQVVNEATSIAGNNDNNVGQLQDWSAAMH